MSKKYDCKKNPVSKKPGFDCIYIYLCNELIEKTARHRKLIFGMWESFGYGYGISDENVDSSWNYDVIVTFLKVKQHSYSGIT